MAFNAMQEENIAAYGGGAGYGGFGGSWSIIIVFFVIAWLLFRDGHRDGIDGHRGFGDGCGCGPCVRPSFIDESNYEEERNLQKKACEIEKDVWKTDCDVKECCCKEIEATHCEGEKTRALIEANYIQDLRDKLAEKNDLVMTLKQEMFTEKKFDQMERMNERRFDQLAGAIGKIDCELPKRPPVFAECVTPNTHDIDCDDRFPRRRRCEGFGFDGCCA